MKKYLSMFFLSVITVTIIAKNLEHHPNWENYICAIILFLPIIFMYHCYFIFFPKAINKSDSLLVAVKIILSSLEETVLDKQLKSSVKNKINTSLLVLDSTMEERRKHLANPTLFRLTKKISLENAWRKFFLDAFSAIERDLKDETLSNWTFKKIQNKMNEDLHGQNIKKILKEMLGDSQYSFLCK